MSIYYHVKEHLVIDNTTGNNMAAKLAENIRHRLSVLAEFMSQERAGINGLRLTADGVQLVSDEENQTELPALLEAMQQAQQMDLQMDYWYYRHGSDGENDPGPFALVEELEKDENEAPLPLDGVFYSAYAECDSYSELGKLYAFGCKDGKRCAGVVEERKMSIEELPDDAEWHTREGDEGLDCQPEELNFDRARVDALCKEFQRFEADISLTSTEDEFAFFVNSITFHSKQDIMDYLRLSDELNEQTQAIGFDDQLSDYSGADARVLRYDRDKNGEYAFYLTSV